MKFYNPFRPHLAQTNDSPVRFAVRRFTLWTPGWEYRDFSCEFWWARSNKNFKDCETFDIKRARGLLAAQLHKPMKPKRLDDVDLAKFLLLQDAHPPAEDTISPAGYANASKGNFTMTIPRNGPMQVGRGLLSDPALATIALKEEELRRMYNSTLLRGMAIAPIKYPINTNIVDLDNSNA